MYTTCWLVRNFAARSLSYDEVQSITQCAKADAHTYNKEIAIVGRAHENEPTHKKWENILLMLLR